MSVLLDRESLRRRKAILEILLKAKRGHIGSAFSIIEIIRVLFDGVLKFDARRPDWPDRDRFILSKGHGCLALYLEMAERGYFPREELDRFCGPDGILGGHPERETTPGIEFSTGSLGHGFPVGVGMALAARMDGKAYRVFTLVGDGECNEGTVWEAALAASKHKLGNLVVMVDYNKMQSYGNTSEVLDLEPLAAKWESFGFAVKETDGHDVTSLKKILGSVPFVKDKPSCLICHTVKGKGVKETEGNPEWHHKAKMDDEELKRLIDSVS